MAKHIYMAGVFNVVAGALGIMAAFIVFTVIGGTGLASGSARAVAVMSSIAGVIGGFLLVVSLPNLVGGIGLLKRQPWARPLVLVVSVFNLVDIPLGTALAIYNFWVLTNPEAVRQLQPSVAGRV